MCIPGRFRTASSPSSTWISRAAIFMLHLGGVQFQFFSHSNLRLVMGARGIRMLRSGPSFCLILMGTPSGLLSPARSGAAYHSNRFSSARFSRVAGRLGNVDHGRARLSAYHHKEGRGRSSPSQTTLPACSARSRNSRVL